MKTLFKFALIFGITTILFLYTYGFRVDSLENQNVDLTKTGMISAKSIPDGASVYIDEKLITATDDTVPGITPGIHTLKITKNGFTTWQKDIEVFEEFVTDITAILVAQSPRFEPLTTTGARSPQISPTLSKLAFFSQDPEDPGIWVIPLSQGGLSLFKSNPNVVLEDTVLTKYSEGLSIEWSPEEDSLLVEGNSGIFYLVDLETSSAEAVGSPDIIKDEWDAALLEKRLEFTDQIILSQEIKDLAVSKQAMWSPDEKKFLYTDDSGEFIQYKVYNMEEPLPVGETRETTVFTTNSSDPQPAVSWYSDSFHLISVEGNIAVDKKGTIYITRIDGTNKTELYNNTLHSDAVYSAPGGDKVIIWTSFKSGDQTDLYTVSIR